MGVKQKKHFSLVGGDPAIDFVNTEVMRAGAVTDLLSSQDALADWMLAAHLVRRRPRVTAATFQAALRVRSAMRRMVLSIAAGDPPKRSDVAVIERELRRARGTLALRVHEGHFSFDFEPSDHDVRFILARAAASFLARHDPQRLRACGGAQCILFFYDTSKSGTRRWCTMAGCGNRAKAAGHYRRSRGGPRR